MQSYYSSQSLGEASSHLHCVASVSIYPSHGTFHARNVFRQILDVSFRKTVGISLFGNVASQALII